MLLIVAFLLLYQMSFTWGAYVLVFAAWAIQLAFAVKGVQDIKKGVIHVHNNHSD